MGRILLLTGCAAAGAGLAAIGSVAVPGRYLASAAVTVREGRWEFGPPGSPWCEDHIFGGVMLDAVLRRISKPMDSGSVYRSLRAGRGATTATLMMEWSDAGEAAEFVNAWADWVRERALSEIGARRPVEPDEVRIERRAEPAGLRIAPRIGQNVLVGLLLGAIAGAALALGQSSRNAASSGANSSAC